MSAIADDAAIVIPPRSKLAKALNDGAVIAKRNAIKIKRVPDLLVFSTLSPIMFILLFGYIFGSAIDVPGLSYREFLMPGIFAQTVIFGATWTGASLADDMQKGIIDRFRSLPMSRSAVLVGRTTADVFINVLTIVIMSVTGLIVGWRIHTSFAEAVGGVPAAAGVRLRDLLDHGDGRADRAEPGGREQRVLHDHLSADVHREHVRADPELSAGAEDDRQLESGLERYPGDARAVRQHQLDQFPPPDTWSLQHPVIYTLIWIVALLAVFIPLSVRQYKRAASR